MYTAPPTVAEVQELNVTVFVTTNDDSGVKEAKIAPPSPSVEEQ